MTRWDLHYLGRPRWDSGLTPPELVAAIEGEHRPPGRALDLGAGTGTNLAYLARHGFQAAGLDISWLAVLRARWKLRRLGLGNVYVTRGDVRDLPAGIRARGPYDFALDIGCFHNLDARGRAAYAAGLHAVSAPGATFLLYVLRPPEGPLPRGAWGTRDDELRAAFAAGWRILGVVEGSFGERTSAWYRLERA
jgi:SAM-dependent methyltransferase